ncbi:unannotated protein [freshwater metagenome]|uniref:Unannotated protein n=1 Tax=freshwater metagenome TaxID=449393 RepID=A0A6J7XP37_9ZZZZ|nr:hypothetical protein [Actinomycetota bacterium]
MRRKTFDKIVTFVGFGLAVFLLIAAGLLNWGATFAQGTVKSQLEAQQITIPADNGDPKADAATKKFFADNGDKLMTTGKQAQMYADHYIGFHLSAMPTYAEASGIARSATSAAAADPANADAQAAASKANATVETVFKGETLRGMLLNAYAFGTLGEIAAIAALVSLVGGILLLLLSIAGLMHIRRTPEDATI